MQTNVHFLHSEHHFRSNPLPRALSPTPGQPDNPLQDVAKAAAVQETLQAIVRMTRCSGDATDDHPDDTLHRSFEGF